MIILMAKQNLVFPDFQHSIVNLAATMAQFLGQPTELSTLPSVSKILTNNYKNVVYLVIDGMGSRILQKHLPVNSFLRQHQIDELTSVFPSTTTAATTSLISALTPADHGWFAWSVDFDGTVIELFSNRNFYTHELTDDRNFTINHLPYLKIWDQASTDREIYTICPDKLSTKIHAPHEIEFATLRQMFHQLHQICAQPNRKMIYAYYSDFDATMHNYGVTSRQSKHLLKVINRKIAHLTKQHPDTLFVITADHGQVDVKGYTYICDDPAIQTCLAHPISFEPRGACFKLKPGMDDQFRQAFQKYTDDFVLFSSQELIQKGVFGNFKLHPEYRKFLGDYIAIGTDTAKMLVFSHGSEFTHHRHGQHLYLGTHTGMTADEMYVPLIVVAGK